MNGIDPAYHSLPGGGLYKRALKNKGEGGGGASEEEIMDRFAKDLFINSEGVEHPLSREEADEVKEIIAAYIPKVYINLVVNGTNFYITMNIPEVPQRLEQIAQSHGVSVGAWTYAVDNLLHYINRLDDFCLGAFKNTVLNNISNISPGTTYYLGVDRNLPSADAKYFHIISEEQFNAFGNAKKAGVRTTLNDVSDVPTIPTNTFTKIEGISIPIPRHTGNWFTLSNVYTHKYAKLKSSTYFLFDAADDTEAAQVYIEIADTDPPTTKTYKIICLHAIQGEIEADLYYWIKFCVRLAYCFIDFHLCKQKKLS